MKYIVLIFSLFFSGIVLAGQMNVGGGYGPQKLDEWQQHNGVIDLSYTFYEYNKRESWQFNLGVGYSYIFSDTKDNNAVHVFSVLPSLRYNFKKSGSFLPFLEVTIGPSYISEKQLGSQKKGEHFTFNDFFTIGVRWGKKQGWEFRYSWQHLSNGNLFHPNSGWDIPFTFHFGRRF